MVALAISWAMSAAALMLASRLFKDVTLQGDFVDALWVAACYAFFSWLLGWFIFGVLGVVTIGIGFVFHFLTQLVTAAIVLKVTSALSSRLTIERFMPAVGTAILLAIAGELAHRIVAM